MIRPLAVLMLAASSSFAQPTIAPPTGPIAESGRFGTRIEINSQNTPGDANSVYRITTPGSYELTANVAVAAGITGIEIASSDVTIDLNGYAIQGFFGFGGTGIGTQDSPANNLFFNVVIRNGSISTMNNAINLNNSNGGGFVRTSGALIEDINAGIVIRGIEGDGIIVRDCTVHATRAGIGGINASIRGCDVTLTSDATNATAFNTSSGRISDCRAIASPGATDTLGYSVGFGSVHASSANGFTTPFLIFDSMATSCFANNPGSANIQNGVTAIDCNFAGSVPAP